MLRLLLLTIWLLTTGATYYVDVDVGTPATNCTEAQTESTAHDTIAEGLGCPSAGDTLIINDGTYVEALTGNDFTNNGTSGNVITVQAETNRGVIIKPSLGSEMVFNFAKAGAAVVEYWTFDGLDMDCTAPVTGCEFYVVRIQDGANHLTFTNSTFRNSTLSCLKDASDSTFTTLTSNIFHDCGCSQSGQTPTCKGQDSHAIYLDAGSNIITDNEIYNVSGTCFQLVENNDTVTNNLCYNQGLAAEGDCEASLCGFNVVAVNLRGTANIDFSNNIFYNISGGIIARQNSTDGVIERNTIYCCRTSVSGDSDGIRNVSTGSGLIVRNNIVIKDTTLAYGIRDDNTGTTTSALNNLCFGHTSGTNCVDNWDTSTGNINETADLEDVANNDFRCQSGGNCENAATDGGEIGACDVASPQAFCTANVIASSVSWGSPTHGSPAHGNPSWGTPTW